MEQEELKAYDSEFQALRKEIVTGLDELTKLHGDLKQKKLSYLKTRIERSKQVYRACKVESRSLKTKIEIDDWNKKCKLYMDFINNSLQQLSDMEGQVTTTSAAMVSPKTTDQILTHAANIQKQDLNSLDNMIKLLATTQRVGQATGVKLAEQTEKLRKVRTEIDEVDGNLKVASKELRSFSRRANSII